MGLGYSSSKSTEHLNYLKSSLDHHKDCIKGLVQCFEKQTTQFDSYLNSTDNQSSGGDAKACEDGNNDESYDEKQHENRLQRFERNILTLMKSNQSSLQWHLKVLRTSFSMLESHFNETIHMFAPGYSSSGNEVQEARKNLDKIHNLTLRVSGLEKENKDLETKIQENTTENKDLETKIQENTTENENLRQKIKELRGQIKNLQESNKSLETSEASLRNDLKKKVDTIKELGMDSSNKTTEIEQLRQNIKELDEQLKILRGKSSALESAETSLRKEIQDQFDNIRIQMFYPNREDTMQKVSCEFKTLLANKLNLERSKIQFIDCQTEDDVNPDMLLFIICINTSRLGTDVVSTLQKLKGCATRNAALIVFHRSYNQFIEVKKAHVLKCVSSCSSLGGMFDFVGDFYKTVYNCADNNLAIEGILNFIYENI